MIVKEKIPPELNKITNTCYYYNSYGYYIYNNKQAWCFLPQEKYYNSNDLLNISNILNILNEATL